jgi:glycine/D-amino acid oxidase-like deaminating enzyme
VSESADIVLIGGGIIGCSVALHLATQLPTARILVVDRGPIAGATSGSCMGHLMVTPDTAQEYAFSKTSVQMWADLEREIGGFDYQPTGALYLADEPEDLELLPVLQKQFADCGDRADILDPKQLRELEPGLAHDLPGALFYAGDGVVLPMTACSAMLRLGQRRNPRLESRPFTEVAGIERAGGRVTAVLTRQGRIACGAAVIACGVWTPQVARLAGLSGLPIVPRAGNLAITAHHVTPVRTQLLEVSYIRFAHGAAKVDPTKTDEDPGGHAVNMQPQSCGGCLIGSTRQFRGFDTTLNRELLHRSLLRAQRYAPALKDAPIVRTWVGLRPYSLDKHPLIGPWPGLDGLWIASGHEGLGISLSMVTGHLLAAQFAGKPCVIDHTPYLPERCA